MCEPTTWIYAATLIISAVSGTLQVQAQNKAAHRQEDYQAQLSEANVKSAGQQMSQVRLREAQQREATAREQEKARLASQKASSTAGVSAGEAGVSGNSVDAIMQEYGMQFGQFREASTRQQQINEAQAGAQVESIRESGLASLLNLNAPVTGGNPLTAGLTFAGQALGATRQYRGDRADENPKNASPRPGK